MPKILVVVVTRNNPELLKHAVSKYQEHPPGVDCDYLIVDASSDSPRQRLVLEKQPLGHVAFLENDRVEVNFEYSWRRSPGYSHYFFAHDDNVPIADNWLLPFWERMHSGYVEPDCPEKYRALPIGRVGGLSQYWRSYDNVRGYSVQCQFLKHAIEAATGEPAPPMFKYADCDRVLVSQECLEATKGLVTLNSFANKRDELCKIFDHFLHYNDEGMYPISKYPPGKHWNKLTLLSEFMNSVMPLLRGYRTVGVDSDGYLEQIHGEDVPWGNRYIAHYGGPNSVKALAKHFGTDPASVKRKLNDPVLLVKSYKYLREYYDV